MEEQEQEQEDGEYSHWPEAVQRALEDDLATSALGGILSYFKTLLIDKSLMARGMFRVYDPLHHSATLVLDGQTLTNLEILVNSQDGSTKGTLFELLCHTHTAFGKRQFRRWLCHPLRNAEQIQERQKSVEDLEHCDELRAGLVALLKSLPDLERLMARAQVGNCKVSDFLALLEGLDSVQCARKQLSAYAQDSTLSSKRLKHLFAEDGFPDLSAALSELDAMFDRGAAKDSNTVTPTRGAVEEYDEAVTTMRKLEKVGGLHWAVGYWLLAVESKPSLTPLSALRSHPPPPLILLLRFFIVPNDATFSGFS
eukprot:m.302191 g.302191  ORF g.302191 m.302191 type:complete len:311 (-) comp15886_c1_seq9:1757-2689(-)